MILFFISFILVFSSSYFLTSVIAPKKSILGFFYLFIIAFAQIVLTFEILSLFTAISQLGVFTLNILFLVSSMYIWFKKSKPLWSLDCNEFRSRFNNSLKLDKTLMWLYVGFLVFLISAFILCLLFPITSSDASSYHAARCLFWIFQGNLNHFDVPDVRNLCLPINSELLYSWVLILVKKDVFLGFFSFVGYVMSIVAIYNILGLWGYCVRKRLWIIFILSSFSSVIIQASSTETDIIIAGLILSSTFLFWYALKDKTNSKIPIFMASLAYALAIGTKTTSLIAAPGAGLFLLGLCWYHKKYKPFILFLVFGIINFLFFSSYNYVLNFLQFGNFLGPTSFMVVSKNYYGLAGAISNFVKYIFMFFDFTGFRWADYINPEMTHFRTSILNFLHVGYVPDGLYTRNYEVNRYLIEPFMGAGILGFLVYLPCVFWAFIKPIFKPRSKKTWFVFAFALVFIINLAVLSFLLAYMVFSVRFVMSFMVISSPILVYSYFSNRNPLKYVIIAFALFYLIIVSTHIWPRPFYILGRMVKEHWSFTYLRELAACKNYEVVPEYTDQTCPLVKQIKRNWYNYKKILVFFYHIDDIFRLKQLEFEGYKIDFALMEDAKTIDFNKYDLIISSNHGQEATFVKDYERRKTECTFAGNKIQLNVFTLAPCIYIPNKRLVGLKNKEASYPYTVKCALSPMFLSEKHLATIGIAGVINEVDTNPYYYIIYRKAY